MTGQQRSRWLDNASTIIGWLLLVAAAFVSARSTGPLGRAYDNWQQTREVRQVVEERWSELSSASMWLGSDSGTARIVQFIDYRCPYCRVFDDSIMTFVREQHNATVIIRPLSSGTRASRMSALSAVCAARQGKFAEMHAVLLSSVGRASEFDAEAMARASNISREEEFNACLESEAAQRVVAQDSAWARALHVRGTPTLVSKSDGVHLGGVPVRVLTEWADRSASQ